MKIPNLLDDQVVPNKMLFIFIWFFRNSWSEPERVRGLDGLEIRAVSASGVTSSALGADGSLWVWGRSKRGQLGLGRDVIEAKSPCRVKSLIAHDIVKVGSNLNQLIQTVNRSASTVCTDM